MAAMPYMERTEQRPESRPIRKIFEILDYRFGKTDTEQSRIWLSKFEGFKRTTGKNFKDFWPRYARNIAKLISPDMAADDDMLFRKAIQSTRLPDGHLPIGLSTLKTMNSPSSVDELKELTIKMYETQRPSSDKTYVYLAAESMDPP